MLEFVSEGVYLRLPGEKDLSAMRRSFYDTGGGTQSAMRGGSGAVDPKSDPGRVQPRSGDFARELESP
jgi:hypothetical protein